MYIILIIDMTLKHSQATHTTGIHSSDAAILSTSGSFSTFTAFPNKNQFDSSDVGKIVRISDSNDRYMMTAHSPARFAKILFSNIVSAYKTWFQKTDGSEPIGIDLTSHVDLYGAIGNGTADDTSAIQAAITACPIGGTVDLGHGKTYLVSTITITKSLTLRMNGATVKLSVRSAADGSPGITVSANGVTIKDGIFNGQRASQPNDGWAEAIGSPTVVGAAYRSAIYAVSRSNITVSDCAINEFAGGGVVTNNCSYVVVKDCTFSHLMYEGVMTYSNNATNRRGNIVRGCTIDTIGPVALGMCDEAGRTAYDTSADGIMLTNCDNAMCYGNTISNTDFCAVKLENCRGATIFSNIGSTNYYSAYPAIQSYNSYNLQIYGNTFDAYGCGMSIQGLYGIDAHDVEIFSNVISNVRDVVGTNDGILAIGKITRLQVHHNKFIGNPRIAGMQCAGNGDIQTNIEFTDNIIKPCNLAALYVSMTGSERLDGLVFARNKGDGTGAYAFQRGLMIEGDPATITRLVHMDNEFVGLQYEYSDSVDACQAPEISGARNAVSSLREIIAKRPGADFDLGGKDLRNFYAWKSATALALSTNSSTAFPDRFLGSNLGANKVYSGTFGLRVRIYTDADHSVAGSIDAIFDGAITTDGDGVASIIINTPSITYDTSRLPTALSGAVCSFTLLTGGFRVSATRPTDVACHAVYKLWLDREDVT